MRAETVDRHLQNCLSSWSQKPLNKRSTTSITLPGDLKSIKSSESVLFNSYLQVKKLFCEGNAQENILLFYISVSQFPTVNPFVPNVPFLYLLKTSEKP